MYPHVVHGYSRWRFLDYTWGASRQVMDSQPQGQPDVSAVGGVSTEFGHAADSDPPELSAEWEALAVVAVCQLLIFKQTSDAVTNVVACFATCT